MPRGGRRVGSGQKRTVPADAKQWNLRVTAEEKALLEPVVKKMLAELRKPSE